MKSLAYSKASKNVLPIPDRYNKRHLYLKTFSFLERRHSSYESIRTGGSASKNLVYNKTTNTTETFVRMVRGALFRTFWNTTRLLSLKSLSPRFWSLLQRTHICYESIQKEESASRIKSLVYTKMSKRDKNLSKMLHGALIGSSWSQYRSFQVKTLISKDLLTLARESQFILVNSNWSVG